MSGTTQQIIAAVVASGVPLAVKIITDYHHVILKRIGATPTPQSDHEEHADG